MRMDFVWNLLLRNQNPAQQASKSKNTFVACYIYSVDAWHVYFRMDKGEAPVL